MIKVGMSELPENWDPRGIWNYQHAMLLPSVFQTLFRLDVNGNIVGDLAESWSFSNSGKTLSIKIRKDAVFHDGSSVRSDDAIFSLSRIFWNDDQSSVEYLKKVFTDSQSVEKGSVLKSLKRIDEKSFEIELPEAYLPLLHVLSMAEFAIYSRSSFLSGHFIGSGPLEPKSLSPNEISLVRNCKYISNSLKIDEIQVVKVNGSADAYEKIKAGKIDLSVGVYDDRLDGLPMKDVSLTRLRSFAIRHFYLNSKSKVLAEKSIREALKVVIQSIVSDPSVRFSFENPLRTYLPRGLLPTAYYNAKTNQTSLSKARSLLKKHASGQPMRILLRQGSNHPALAKVLDRELASLGFKVDARLRSPTEISEAIKSGDFEMSRSDYFGMFPDPDGLLEPLGFIEHVDSSKLLASISKIRSQADSEKRLKEYSKAFEAWEEEVPVVPLYQISLPVMHSNKVTIPSTDYRFASDLWRVFWKAE